jgi:hypothetical protein
MSGLFSAMSPSRPFVHRGRYTVTVDDALWTAQAAIAFFFFWVGGLAFGDPTVFNVYGEPMFSYGFAPGSGPEHLIGLCELGLALLVVLPSATRFWPLLAPLVALALAPFAVLHCVTYAMHGRIGATIVAALVALCTLFVAWGRGFTVRIPKRYLDEEDPPHSLYPDLAPDPRV